MRINVGGATHHFTYPLFFSFIDLEQVSQIGWSLWPIFKLNGGSSSFCSLDEKDHLKDWVVEENNRLSDILSKSENSANKHDEQSKHILSGKIQKEKLSNKKDNNSDGLHERVLSFINNRTKGTKTLTVGGSIRLMTHLTYFGYCFNPISIIYCLRPDKKKDEKIENEKLKGDIANSGVDLKENHEIISATKLPLSDNIDSSTIDSVIAEVSNTPWIEMHCYMLDESVENVRLRTF